MAEKIREITPQDRLYHELRCIKRQLEMALAEYEAEVEQPTTPPETPSFRLIVKKIKAG